MNGGVWFPKHVSLYYIDNYAHPLSMTLEIAQGDSCEPIGRHIYTTIHIGI